MNIFLNWLISAIAIMIASFFVPGVSVTGLWPALITAVVLGLINAVLRPILIILTLPVNILSLGLFTLVINALLVMLAGSIVRGFNVSGFLSALLFSIILFFVNLIFNAIKQNARNSGRVQ